jgi:hypothetical protein
MATVVEIEVMWTREDGGRIEGQQAGKKGTANRLGREAEEK